MAGSNGIAELPANTKPRLTREQAIRSLPNGKTVDEVSPAELVRILEAAGVRGVSASNGYQKNVDVYLAHLREVGDMGAIVAVARWLDSANGSDGKHLEKLTAVFEQFR